jgi:hypothetical protein
MKAHGEREQRIDCTLTGDGKRKGKVGREGVVDISRRLDPWKYTKVDK